MYGPVIKVIKAGRLIDGTGGPPVENATVVIEDSIIKEVGENLAYPESAQVIDACEKTVMPGLIDAHMHCNGPRPEDTFQDIVTRHRELRLLKAVDDTQAYLSAGFTTAKACGGMNGIFIKRAVDEGTVAKVPRLVSTSYALANTMGNPHPYLPEQYVDARTSKHDGHVGGFNLICDGVDECIKATRYAMIKGSDLPTSLQVPYIRLPGRG